jgi:hypothetical protein
MADMSRRPIVLEAQGDNYDDRARRGGYEIEGSTARSRFREFFRNFRQGNNYIYREALIINWQRQKYVIEVDLGHVNEYDDVLLQSLQVWLEIMYLCGYVYMLICMYTYMHVSTYAYMYI